MVEDKFPRFLLDLDRILFHLNIFHILFFRFLRSDYFLFLTFLFLFHNSITLLDSHPVQSLYFYIFFKIGYLAVCCHVVEFINGFFLYILFLCLYLLGSINHFTYKDYNVIWDHFSEIFNLLLFPRYVVAVVGKDVLFHLHSVYFFVECWGLVGFQGNQWVFLIATREHSAGSG